MVGVCNRSSYGRGCPVAFPGKYPGRASPRLCSVTGRQRPRWWSLSLCVCAVAPVHTAQWSSLWRTVYVLVQTITHNNNTTCHLLALQTSIVSRLTSESCMSRLRLPWCLKPERSENYSELLDASLPPKEEGYNVDRPRFLLGDYHKPSKDQATRHSMLGQVFE